MRKTYLLLLMPMLLLLACSTPQQQESAEMDWAIVVHGGAGSLVKDEAMKTQYECHLLEAIKIGGDMLRNGATALDGAGNISMVFNTDLMHRAWAKSDGEYGVGLAKDEEKVFNRNSDK